MKMGHVRYKNYRFFDVTIQFWDPLLTSDVPGGHDLQNLLTSGGQNMKSMKISHEVSNHRFFSIPIPFWYPFWNLDSSEGHWPPNTNDLRRYQDEINENGVFYLSNHCFSESNAKFIFESESPKCIWSSISLISVGQNSEPPWTWIMLGIKSLFLMLIVQYKAPLLL